MKDMKGTNIRKGTYLVWYDNQHIFQAKKTIKNRTPWSSLRWEKLIEYSVEYGVFSPGYFNDEDMPNVLVIPRRMVVPKLKLDQIKLYVALAGLEVTEEEDA